MTITTLEKELTVETSSKPGTAAKVLGTLAEAKINLKSLCAYDMEDKGHFLMITDNNTKAEQVLKNAGWKVSTNDVIRTCVNDKPGACANIVSKIGNAGINIEYLYSTCWTGCNDVCVVLKTNDNTKTLNLITNNRC